MKNMLDGVYNACRSLELRGGLGPQMVERTEAGCLLTVVRTKQRPPVSPQANSRQSGSFTSRNR